jgi:hypothetical protein
MSKLPKVLFIEDYAPLRSAYARYFHNQLDMVFASYLLEAERMVFNSGMSFDGIVTDANLGSEDKPDTPPLIKRIIASGWKGVLIGVSGRDDFLQELEKAGCKHVISKTHPNLIPLLEQFLLSEIPKE